MATTINANNTDGVVITPDTSGELELQANGVTKAKVTANGLQDANGASLRGGMYRNLIINGDMQIAQRGTSVSGITGSGYYTVDRFQFFEATDGTYTMTQDTDVPSGQGFSNSVKINTTTADTSITGTQSLRLRHTIEAQNLQHLKFGTANAESITVSFWIKSNLTGDCVVRILSSDSNRHITYLATINAADTWEKKTITYAGDTTGAINNDNGAGLILEVWGAAGPDVSSGPAPTTWQTNSAASQGAGQTVNLADSTSNYINITGVQLEVGEGASDFEHLPYDIQLQRCQRYYIRIGGNPSSSATATRTLLGQGYSSTTTTIATSVPVPVMMRSSPTVDFGGTLTASGYNYGTSVSNITLSHAGNLSNINVSATVSTTTANLARGIYIRTDIDADAFVDFSSEL